MVKKTKFLIVQNFLKFTMKFHIFLLLCLWTSSLVHSAPQDTFNEFHDITELLQRRYDSIQHFDSAVQHIPTSKLHRFFRRHFVEDTLDESTPKSNDSQRGKPTELEKPFYPDGPPDVVAHPLPDLGSDSEDETENLVDSAGSEFNANSTLLELTVALINQQLPQHQIRINEALKNTAPEAIGNCQAVKEAGSTGTCICLDGSGVVNTQSKDQVCTKDLYYTKSNYMYEAQVRYVGGLNTARIENMKISAERLRYNLDVEMSIGHLPMSFRIAQCLLFNKCLALFDSLDACCGRERKLSFRLAMQCSPQKPFIRGTAIQNLKFEKPLVIAPKFFRLIPVKVREITNDVESTVQQQVTEMLPRTPWLDLNGNGKLETLAGALNDIIMTELAKIPVNIPFPCLEWKEQPKGKN